jgi:NADPH:quinone reductase-like Zn-dependent oxidoreductase
MSTHRAAVVPAKGEPLTVQSRPTPKPGPGELLVAVKSVALNPADWIMRDQGLFIPAYPAIIGFDVSGLVLEIGDGVPTSAAGDGYDGPCFRPGKTRVAAYSASVWKSSDPDYGIFQERCLIPWQHAVPLPDESISYNHAATLPVAVQVPLSAWDAMGIPRMGASASSRPNTDALSREAQGTVQRQALLIWGASSSVGTMGVQSARLLRDGGNNPFAAVYATCGSANMDYVRSLGADRVFDHKDAGVVDAIVSAAREDGLTVRYCFLAIGQLTACQGVLKAFLTEGRPRVDGGEAKIASSPPIPADAEVLDGIETIWVRPAMDDEETRLAQFRYWMGTWLRESLAKGTIKPSPEPRVIGKGVEAINAGLDMLRDGVSCTKLVVEIEE